MSTLLSEQTIKTLKLGHYSERTIHTCIGIHLRINSLVACLCVSARRQAALLRQVFAASSFPGGYGRQEQ